MKYAFTKDVSPNVFVCFMSITFHSLFGSFLEKADDFEDEEEDEEEDASRPRSGKVSVLRNFPSRNLIGSLPFTSKPYLSSFSVRCPGKVQLLPHQKLQWRWWWKRTMRQGAISSTEIRKRSCIMFVDFIAI